MSGYGSEEGGYISGEGGFYDEDNNEGHEYWGEGDLPHNDTQAPPPYHSWFTFTVFLMLKGGYTKYVDHCEGFGQLSDVLYSLSRKDRLIHHVKVDCHRDEKIRKFRRYTLWTDAYLKCTGQ